MAKLLLLVLFVASVLGCSQEAAQSEIAPASAPSSSGDSQASTNSQLSLNPDYNK